MDDVINLTPHAIVIRVADHLPGITIPPSGTVARVEEERREHGSLWGVPVTRVVPKAVIGLPPPAEVDEGVRYLVSAMVREAAEALGRRDCVSPDTGAGAVRNDKGHIVAVRGFVVGAR